MYILNPADQRFRVVFGLMHRAEPLQAMYHRGYQTTTRLNDGLVNAVVEQSQFGSSYMSSQMAGLAGQFIRPTANAQQQIAIPNGWGTQRFRFILQLEYQMLGGNRITQYVTGFTNHSELSFNGLLDPSMMLYFNNSVLLQDMTYNTPNGLVTTPQVTTASQVLSSGALGLDSGYNGMASDIRTLRPEDVFSVSSAANMHSTIDDLRPRFTSTSMVKKSLRSNNSPTRYMADSLLAAHKAFNQAEYGAGMGEIAGNISSELAAAPISADNFLAWIQARQLMTSGGAVPWGELVAASPQADAVMQVVRDQGNGGVQRTGPSALDTNHWHGTNNETVLATMMAQTGPELMMENLLGALSIVCSNTRTDLMGTDPADPMSRHVVYVTQARRLDQSPVGEDVLMAIRRRLHSQILPEISMGGMLHYDIEVHFQLLGSTLIRISVNGGDRVEFTAPTFCDSLFAPTVTTSQVDLQNLASDMGALALGVNSAASPASMAHHTQLLSLGQTAGPQHVGFGEVPPYQAPSHAMPNLETPNVVTPSIQPPAQPAASPYGTW